MNEASTDDVVWAVDGAGQWALDTSHLPAGTTPISQRLLSLSMPPAMRKMFAEFGTPADTLDVAWVNGFMYTRLRPLIGADKPAKRLPPAFVLKIAVRLHPEMRRRNARARATLESTPWTKVIHDWHHGMRAGIVAENLALQDVGLAALDDTQLVAHVNRTLDHAITEWNRHFWLHGFDLGPIGLYLYDSARWGLTPLDLLPLLEGASPSTSAPRRRLVGIRRSIEAAGADPATLDEARAVSPEVGDAIDDYLRHHGAQLFSRYDLDGVTLGERPDLVLATLMSAEEPVPTDRVETLTAAVRARVPAGDRDEFDRLLGEARSAMDLRDDNGPITAEWTLGLVRLALLEVGRRLADRGLVHDRLHVVELEVDELTPALFAGSVPAEELASRAALRQERKRWTPPSLIGEPEPSPPPDVLPTHLRRMVEMVQLVISQMAMDGTGPTTGLAGVGVGTQAVRGRACVAATPEEALDLLEPGDILVVASTTPAYNLVLSLASGVVTAAGGPMSHAAVLARELGIPAVVGAPGALSEIVHGSQIEVDPVAGEVRVLSAV